MSSTPSPFQRAGRVLLLFTLCLYGSALAELRLPQFVGDGMVLQRDTELPLWGWAEPGQTVAVTLLEQRVETVTDEQGRWQVTLPPQPAGGPHRLTINERTLDDVWLGDVWVASGQSNMELPMRRLAPLHQDDIASARDPALRFFVTPKEYHFKGPRDDYSGGRWQWVNPDTLPEFAAAAYFFGRQLRQNQGVPIGIINAALGGSPAQAWMSEDALKAFPEHHRRLQTFKDDNTIERIERADRERAGAWYEEMNRRDPGYEDGEYLWAATDDKQNEHWQPLTLPGSWTDGENPQNGAVWLRKTFTLPESLAGQSGLLVLGKIIDSDVTFLNGQQVGSTGYRYPPRRYPVPEGLLRAGENTLVVRVVSERGRGRFVADKTYELQLADTTIDLDGQWQTRPGAVMPELESQTFVRWQPGGLYNAMLAPLLGYSITGVIWYQGESNVGAAGEYGSLFPAMIANWRQNWGRGDFPFLFVQLANYDPEQLRSDEPVDSEWARLREAQLHTLNTSDNTAMVVAVDIGEWNDIHPLNKQDVGERLALAARAKAYGEAVVYSGPLYRSMSVKNGKAVIRFDHSDGMTTADGKPPGHLAIAGEDGEFVWAQGEIRNDRLLVWSEEVAEPVAVRYGWADNPEGANLINGAGLPASPFRTDDR